jgi:voltage-gated potassium channel
MMPNPHHFRAKLFNILHKPSPENPAARYANYFLAFLILVNALFVALETVPAMSGAYGAQFRLFEWLSTGLFTIEYVARIWVCVEQAKFSHPVTGRIRYAVHLLPLLDLVVITTFWMPIDLRFLRIARIVRLLKVLRLEHFEESLQRIGSGIRRRRALIAVAITMMAASIYASSSLVYQIEHSAQPEVFTSIPATFWWATETLTTIGYGDMTPITPLGKFFVGLISIFGIGIFALPTAIVTAAILEAGASDPRPIICNHCGKVANHPAHALAALPNTSSPEPGSG